MLLFKIKYLFRLFLSQTYWRARFAAIGYRSVIFKPLLITNPGRIWIGSRTQIREFTRMEVISRPGLGWEPALRVGDRVMIEQGVHIVCQCEVTIGNDVAITAYCAIVDTHHPHDPPDTLPAIGQRLSSIKSRVVIGDGTFIGMHSVILPDVVIGKGCVIGAGSVVKTDVPDYSVAVGSPARVVSRFDQATRTWRRSANV